jgi:hypothetical protein
MRSERTLSPSLAVFESFVSCIPCAAGVPLASLDFGSNGVDSACEGSVNLNDLRGAGMPAAFLAVCLVRAIFRC